MKKFFMFATIAISGLFLTSNVNAEEVNCTDIKSDEELINALTAEGSTCQTVTLGGNIELKKNIGITKSVTIVGNGYTISASSDNWTGGESGDQSLLTAVGSSAQVTLQNLKLTNSKKYGAQAYNGGSLTLDNVTVENCKFGGILANGGTVVVKDLYLGYNGEGSNNGIELSKASSITDGNDPKLVMDGKLASNQTDNVIWIATNDGSGFTKYDVENTANTTDKVFIHDNQVVITDENNNVLYVSNENKNVKADNNQNAISVHFVTIKYNGTTTKVSVESGKTLAEAIDLTSIKNAVKGKTFVNFTLADGTEYDENAKVTTDLELTANYKDIVVNTVANPNTSDNIMLFLGTLLVSGLGLTYTIRKRYN